MSARYPGGFITKTPTAPTSSSAPGIWTLDQAMQNQKAGNWPTGFPNYIEDVFSTYLYTGNASTQTITNGIDLAGKGGLVWGKSRSAANAHNLYDTARGASMRLASNLTNAEANTSPAFSSFNSNGFSLNGSSDINTSSADIVSWTFRKQPKFFDIVTYTGNGSTYQTISHSLASTPGCIIIKGTSGATNWGVYHRSIPTGYLTLNTTNADTPGLGFFQNVGSTSFETAINTNGVTYVAYLFAHNAGGFGASGNDNVISCGSFTTSASNTVVNLGYEPQWILFKATGAASSWEIIDTMRQASLTDSLRLFPNSASAEMNAAAAYVYPTSTGFVIDGPNRPFTGDGIYIAIRRGPMKVPTAGTSVFTPISATASTGTSRTVGFPADLTINTATGISGIRLVADRLRGYANASSGLPPMLDTNNTTAERTSTAATVYNVWNTTALDGPYYNSYASIWWHFCRAPGYFDVVCYTGNNAVQNISHNLTVAPELMIVKPRSYVDSWVVYHKDLGATNYVYLNSTLGSAAFANWWNNTAPTASVFTVGTYNSTSGATYVAYLFATCPGVSKVGSYTGTGALQTVNCGFTAGARFVLIKRTDSTGDWYVYDSARGISSGNDPYLLLNSTAAETTGTNYVDTDTTGFKVTAAAPVGLNASGGTYIFLAIA